jgi:hypothetical protein
VQWGFGMNSEDVHGGSGKKRRRRSKHLFRKTAKKSASKRAKRGVTVPVPVPEYFGMAACSVAIDP